MQLYFVALVKDNCPSHKYFFLLQELDLIGIIRQKGYQQQWNRQTRTLIGGVLTIR